MGSARNPTFLALVFPTVLSSAYVAPLGRAFLFKEAIILIRTPFYTFLGTFVPGGFCTIFKKTNQSPIARRMESASSVGWPQARRLEQFKFAYEFGDEKSTFLSQLGELYKTYAL